MISIWLIAGLLLLLALASGMAIVALLVRNPWRQ